MMLSLIAHHFTVNSGLTDLFDLNNITGNMIFLQIFGMWGKTAINVFTLITGYFMVKSDLTWKKWLKLILEAVFYTYLFYIIFLVSGYEPFSLKEFIKTILFVPYDAGRYYTGSMIIMMLFIPFANILIRAMTKRQYQILLGLSLLYFTGISTFLKNDVFDFVFWMLVVYFIGGYIRIYPCRWDNIRYGILGTVCSIVLMILSILTIDFVGSKFGLETYYYFVSDANKILAVAAAISIFIMFKNWKLGYIKWINVIASTTFGVLLVHANSATIRRFLWIDVFDNVGHYNDSNLILYACGVVILVYVIAVCIDILRMKFVEKPVFNWLSKVEWVNRPLYTIDKKE